MNLRSSGNNSEVVADSLLESRVLKAETKSDYNENDDLIPAHSRNTIPPVAASTDSLIWIAKRVGPLITAKRLIRCLLAGLTICYEVSHFASLFGSFSSFLQVILLLFIFISFQICLISGGCATLSSFLIGTSCQ